MQFERDLLLEAVRSCNQGDLHLTEPPEHYEKWMVDRCLPGELVDFLRTTAFSCKMRIGDFSLNDFRRIRSWDGNFPSFVDQGFINVGATYGGDMILIDFHGEGRTGFLSHDGPYYLPRSNLRSMFQPVTRSIGEFAMKAAREEL